MIRRCILFALSIVLCSNGSTAFAQPDPRKIPAPNIGRVQDEVQKQLERMLDQIGQQDQEAAAQLRRLLQEARQQPDFQRKMRPSYVAGNARWGGLQFKKVDAELQEKLGLPDNEGLVVIAVDANSPADKAGLKANDVIVKLGDKAAPSDAVSFANLVKEQKANAAIDIVVVRDGKEETLKGVEMPNAVQAGPSVRPGFGGPKRLMPNPFPMPWNPQEGVYKGFQLDFFKDRVSQTLSVFGDDFSGSYAKGDVRIEMAGKIEKGVPTVTGITIRQGDDTKKYSTLREVPAPHREVVEAMLFDDVIQRRAKAPAR